MDVIAKAQSSSSYTNDPNNNDNNANSNNASERIIINSPSTPISMIRSASFTLGPPNDNMSRQSFGGVAGEGGSADGDNGNNNNNNNNNFSILGRAAASRSLSNASSSDNRERQNTSIPEIVQSVNESDAVPAEVVIITTEADVNVNVTNDNVTNDNSAAVPKSVKFDPDSTKTHNNHVNLSNTLNNYTTTNVTTSNRGPFLKTSTTLLSRWKPASHATSTHTYRAVDSITISSSSARSHVETSSSSNSAAVSATSTNHRRTGAEPSMGILGRVDKISWSYGFQSKVNSLGIDYEPLPVFTGMKTVELEPPKFDINPDHRIRHVPIFYSTCRDLFADLAHSYLLRHEGGGGVNNAVTEDFSALENHPHFLHMVYRAFPTELALETHIRKLPKDQEERARSLLDRLRAIRRGLFEEVLQVEKLKLARSGQRGINPSLLHLIKDPNDHSSTSENNHEFEELLKLHQQQLTTTSENNGTTASTEETKPSKAWLDEKINQFYVKFKTVLRNMYRANREILKSNFEDSEMYVLKSEKILCLTAGGKKMAVKLLHEGRGKHRIAPVKKKVAPLVIGKVIEDEGSGVKKKGRKQSSQNGSVSDGFTDHAGIGSSNYSGGAGAAGKGSNKRRKSDWKKASLGPDRSKPKPLHPPRVKSPFKSGGIDDTSQSINRKSSSAAAAAHSDDHPRGSVYFPKVTVSNVNLAAQGGVNASGRVIDESEFPPLTASLAATVGRPRTGEMNTPKLMIRNNRSGLNMMRYTSNGSIIGPDDERYSNYEDPDQSAFESAAMTADPVKKKNLSSITEYLKKNQAKGNILNSNKKPSAADILFKDDDDFSQAEGEEAKEAQTLTPAAINNIRNNRRGGRRNYARLREPSVSDEQKAQQLEKAKDAKINGIIKSLLQDASVLDGQTKSKFLKLSAPAFDKTGSLPMDMLPGAIRLINPSMNITDSEINYIKGVLEIFNRDSVEQEEFCMVAALAERMSLMDNKMRISFFQTDFKKLDHQVRHFRDLYSVYAGQNASGNLNIDDLLIILQATGLEPKYFDRVLEHLHWNGKKNIEFLDFISYIPFFARVHNSIVGNILKNDVNIEDLLSTNDTV